MAASGHGAMWLFVLYCRHNSTGNSIMTTEENSQGDRMKRLQGLPPIADKDARVLVLGTFLGNDSLRKQQYYAHPRNQFWKIIEALFGIARGDDYAQRCRRLAARGVAVWDVIGKCRRYGSSNSEIRDAEANDFAAFYRQHPHIAAVFFNGKDTGERYRRLVALPPPAAPQSGATVRFILPSTSPANTHLSLAGKIEEWRTLRQQAAAD